VTTPWLSAALSALHVLAIALSIASVWSRYRAIRAGDVDRILAADNVWGISALLILGSGLGRLFGPFEKGLAWYLANPLFLHKMILFGGILVLELWPMITFIRWRIARARGGAPDLRHLPALARVNLAQIVILVLMPFVAAGMARGLRW
jgi:putative membrane protein